MRKDKNAASLLLEDLKNGIREEIKQEIYERYAQCARWDGAGFDDKKSRFELADFDHAFVQEILRTYGIPYAEYLRIYCEVRNDGFFYPDAIEDVDAFMKEKLAQEKGRS